MAIVRRVALANAVLSVLACGGAAGADKPTTDMDFRGINAIHVTASPMPAAARDCNIDGDALVRDLERQFSAGGLKSATGVDTLATITVLSSSEPTRGLCSSAVMLGAYAKESFFDQGAGWIRSGYVVVWQSGSIATSKPEDHLKTVRSVLTQLGDSMLVDWQSQNAPKAN